LLFSFACHNDIFFYNVLLASTSKDLVTTEENFDPAMIEVIDRLAALS
jgi:hypothetical protein